MKFLFDENLSPKLPKLLSEPFPGSAHVRDCGLKGLSDEAIWDYARQHGFTLISKDGDFYQRILLKGSPPKLIWICMGNCSRDQILSLLLKFEKEIRALESGEESVLMLA